MRRALISVLSCAAMLVVAALVSGCVTDKNPPSATMHPAPASASAPMNTNGMSMPMATTPTVTAPVEPAKVETPTPNPTPTLAAATGGITLTAVRADSEETASEDGHAKNAVDGKPETMWHTQWTDENPPCPHEIVIEMTPPSTIKGFTYLPRQDAEVNGTIKDYEFYVSDSDTDFGQPVKKGSFEFEAKEKKTVTFEPKKGRYIKLKALSEIGGGAWTSAAEIGVVPN